MRLRITALAFVGTLLVALDCDNPQPLAPPELQAGPSVAQLAQAPAGGNGNTEIIAVDFTFPVECDAGVLNGHMVGWFQIRTFDRAGTRNTQLLVAHAVFTMTNAAGATFVWREIGTDHWTIDQDGNVQHALNGRAGSFGNIGRLIVNDDTGEVEFVAGNDVGNTFANACAALT